MNVLIVYAHHEPSSFTAAMKNVAIQALEGQGHSVTVSDLYGQGFSAVAQKWDFVTTGGQHFNYMLEQRHAARLQNAFSPDIVGEIQKIQNAEVLLIVSPIWWFSVPAILKGWFDRVLAMGVTWDSGKIYENGLMRGKQAMLAVAAGHPADYYKGNGRHRITATQMLHPINHGTLAFCGFNVQEPFIARNVMGASQAGLEQALKDYEFKIKNFIASPQWLTFYG
ncbi:MAG: NAD(P)H-dependent oxidoreductase [Candidatus Angelobacter sp.]